MHEIYPRISLVFVKPQNHCTLIYIDIKYTPELKAVCMKMYRIYIYIATAFDVRLNGTHMEKHNGASPIRMERAWKREIATEWSVLVPIELSRSYSNQVLRFGIESIVLIITAATRLCLFLHSTNFFSVRNPSILCSSSTKKRMHNVDWL